MNEISLVTALTRLAESSPVIVGILLFACGILWKALREEMAEARQMTKELQKTTTDSVQATQSLTMAVNSLRDRIEFNR